jgi:hypothetical protein
LEVVNKTEWLSVLFEYTEPARMIGCIRWLVNSGCDFGLDDVDDSIEKGGRNGNVP